MPRKINFFDGFTSSTEPTLGNIVASNLVSYPDDAAYEAAEQGAPQAGNIYYNTTTCKIRYYDHNAMEWKDSDDESLDRIVLIEAEQLVQNTNIATNSADIAALDVDVMNIEAEQIVQNDAIALNTAKVSFPEAPQDGLIYGRKDAAWEVVDSGSSNSRLIGDSDITNNEVVGTINYVDLLTTPFTATGFTAIEDKGTDGFNSQSFTTGASSVDLGRVTFKVGTPTASNVTSSGEIYVELYADDGSGDPATATVLATSSTETGDFSVSGAYNQLSFTFSSFTLSPSTTYWLSPVLVTSYDSGTNDIRMIFDSSDPYAGGVRKQLVGGSWATTGSSGDLDFKVETIDSVTSGGNELVIDSDIYYQVPGLADDRNTIEAQTILLANDGDVAFFTKNEVDSTTIVPVSVVGVDSFVPGPGKVVIARRKGDKIIFGNNDKMVLSDGETFNICENIGGGGAANISSNMFDTKIISGITVGATTTAPTKGTVARDRVLVTRRGNMGRFRYEYRQTTAGTNGSGEYLYSLPIVDGVQLEFGPSVEFFTTAFANVTSIAEIMSNGYGVTNYANPGTSSGTDGFIIPYNSTQFRVMANVNPTSIQPHDSGYYAYNTIPDLEFSLQFEVPIKDWTSQAEILAALPINLQYSTTEHLSGETWIDGRPIYRRVLYFATNVTSNGTIDTWPAGLEFIDSLRRTDNDNWVLDFFNASGTTNRVIINYNEVTGVVSVDALSGTGIEAGTNFIIKYVK